MTGGDHVLDDIFHACALRAWMDTAEASGQWPPPVEATRRLAYRYYEEWLREQNTNRPVGLRRHIPPDSPGS